MAAVGSAQTCSSTAAAAAACGVVVPPAAHAGIPAHVRVQSLIGACTCTAALHLLLHHHVHLHLCVQVLEELGDIDDFPTRAEAVF